MPRLSTVVLMLGKVPLTAWESRVLLMKAHTSPALQGKGVGSGGGGAPSSCPPLQIRVLLSIPALTTSKKPDPEGRAPAPAPSVAGKLRHRSPMARLSGRERVEKRARPRRTSSPRPPLPLFLCPAVPGAAPANNGSFLARPPPGQPRRRLPNPHTHSRRAESSSTEP